MVGQRVHNFWDKSITMNKFDLKISIIQTKYVTYDKNANMENYLPK